MLKFSLIVTTLLLIQSALFSQSPPSSDIFLANITINNSAISISKPENITKRDGYDNQPSFSPDGKSIYFTSIRDTLQSDSYRYDIDGGSTIKLTDTQESEYSPTVMADGKYFSVVRVEKDSTQRLWRFTLDGKNPELILKTIKPVGYHSWIDSNHVVLFVLGEPVTLQYVDIRTEKAETLAINIGRALHRIPGKNVMSYIKKENDSVWYVDEYNFGTHTTSRIIQTLKGSEDLVWLSNGTMLMGNGSILYKCHPGSDTTWTQVADLKSAGISSMTRLAVSRDGKRIAIVGIPGK